MPVFNAPPKPNVAFRVGITGHRPNLLPAEQVGSLESTCSGVLSRILSIAVAAGKGEESSVEAPKVTVISPLAEGSDRIMARAALGAGMGLQCLLPFQVDEYELDFDTQASRAEFRALIKSASALLELDGGRLESPRAYEILGRILVENSDVLVAIWNGEPAAGLGGTAHVVKEAVAAGVPVIWIKLDAHQTVSLLLSGPVGEFKEFAGELIWQRLEDLLGPPAFDKESLTAYELYFQEPATSGLKVEQEIRRASELLSRYLTLAPSVANRLIEKVAPHFAWADRLAVKYALLYRTASYLVYVFGALATSLALIGLISEHHIKFAAFVELVVIVLILGITGYCFHARWHQRWLDYRMLAEELRSLRFLWMLGNSLPTAPVTAHIAQKTQLWPIYHARRVVRSLGLASMDYAPPRKAAISQWLLQVEIADQLLFHEQTARRMNRFNEALHITGTMLFVCSGLVCAAHMIFGESLQNLLIFLSAVLPTFGGTLFAIRNHGEYLRIGHRSSAMAFSLRGIQARFGGANSMNDTETLRMLARELSNIMRGEAVDWHAFIKDKPLGLPL